VEPNRAFLHELRVLENEVFGEWFEGKLTLMDVPSDPTMHDWREDSKSIITLLGHDYLNGLSLKSVMRTSDLGVSGPKPGGPST
jgi:hypothetical protein